MGTNATTPVGRIVKGNLYRGNDKDAEGKPLVTKTGANAGQPRLDFFFAIAIPKAGEQHWAHTPWGQEIYKVGATAFPQACQSPSFAWKITDGDSTIPNKRGKRPCDQEGHAGHWILHFSSGFAPKIYRQRDGAPGVFDIWQDVDAVKPGYFVQVNFTCDGNGSQSQPGVYLNHSMVCFTAYGQEIVFGPDAASAGFGGAPLPAGASLTPPAGAFNPPPAVATAPGLAPAMPPLPGLPPAMPAAPAMPINFGALLLQPVPGAAYTIEALRAQGWTDDQIVTGGYATRPAPAAPAAPGLPPLPPGFSAQAPAAPAAPAAPVGVVPNPGFVQMPPVAPAGLVLNPGAPGTLEQFRAAGWTDDQLVAAGHARRG